MLRKHRAEVNGEDKERTSTYIRQTINYPPLMLMSLMSNDVSMKLGPPEAHVTKLALSLEVDQGLWGQNRYKLGTLTSPAMFLRSTVMLRC